MMTLAIFLIHCAEVAAFTWLVNRCIDFLAIAWARVLETESNGSGRRENLHQQSEPQPR